jgi:hypothetical protein
MESGADARFEGARLQEPDASSGPPTAAAGRARRRFGALDLTAAGAVAVVVAMLSVPLVLDRAFLSPDVVNYLGVSNSLAHGSGFVEPIQWHYYLPGGPPQPAWGFLSPVISVVLAVPIALGCGLTGAAVVHAVCGSLIAGVMLLVARRYMSLPAATAAAIGLGWCGGWLQASYFVLTEPWAILSVLLIAGTAPSVGRSSRDALLCAAVTIFGWLTRANIPALAAAVVVAEVWRVGPRAAVRRRPLWLYLAGVFVGIGVLRLGYRLVTGVAPYANYGAFFEQFTSLDLMRLDKKYVGMFAFMREHWDAVVARWQDTIQRSTDLFFTDPRYNWVGFLLPIVVTWGVFGRARGVDDEPTPGEQRDSFRRVAAFGGLGFLLLAITTYGGFEPRYLLPSAACLWLAGVGSIDQIIDRIAFRPAHRQGLPAPGPTAASSVGAESPLSVDDSAPAAIARADAPSGFRWGFVIRAVMPLAALALVATTTLEEKGGRAWRAAEGYRSRRTTRVHFRNSEGIPPFCRNMKRGYVAIATEAEAVHFYCGNPVLRLPVDATNVPLMQTFLRERHVRYLLVEKAKKRFHDVAPQLALKVVRTTDKFVLYESAAQRKPAWSAPTALACLGNADGCPDWSRRRRR